ALVLRHFGDVIPGIGEFGLLLAAVAVVALFASRRLAAPLAQLAKEAEAVRHFDFSDHPLIHSPVREIDQLGAAFDLMRDAVRRFLRINRRLATETDFEVLRPWLLDKMVDLAGARGGALYLVDGAEDGLRATALDTEGGRARGNPELPRLQEQALPLLLADARATMRPARGHLGADELRAMGLDPALAASGMLALPLRDRHEQLLGMLLLFKDGEIDAANASFIEAL